MIFCGIFDGHGQWGHLVSKRVRESLPASLLCNWQETLTSTSLDQDFEMEMDRNLHGFDMWKQSFLKTYAAIDKELKHSSKLNSYWSGATALTIIKQVIRRFRFSLHGSTSSQTCLHFIEHLYEISLVLQLGLKLVSNIGTLYIRVVWYCF